MRRRRIGEALRWIRLEAETAERVLALAQIERRLVHHRARLDDAAIRLAIALLLAPSSHLEEAET